MRIKSTVWQVLAMGSFGVGMLYALGIEGGAQVGGSITDGQFITAMVLILLAVLFMQLGFHAECRENTAKRKVHRTPSVPPSADAARRKLPQCAVRRSRSCLQLPQGRSLFKRKKDDLQRV